MIREMKAQKDIANEIRSGIKNTNSIFIEDRYAAIRQAIESAKCKRYGFDTWKRVTKCLCIVNLAGKSGWGA